VEVRLKIMKQIFKEFGLDKESNWQGITSDLIMPCFNHHVASVRKEASELLYLMYGIVGDDLKIYFAEFSHLFKIKH